MTRFVYAGFIAAALILAAYGCGKPSSDGSSTPPPATTPLLATTPSPSDTTSAVTPPGGTSPYDEGPRAAASPVNGALASQGERLFQSKGCAVCHGFGRKITCPDLDGVAQRRTAQWMEHQILHPEIMAKQDPITRQLLTQYKLPMTNQGLTPDEAKKVIEFLKRKTAQSK